jgi:hypothetical protein
MQQWYKSTNFIPVCVVPHTKKNPGFVVLLSRDRLQIGMWLRIVSYVDLPKHYATSPKVAGSILDVIACFQFVNLSSSTMALGSTHPLTEMNTWNFPVGKARSARRADNFTPIPSRLSRQCGIHNISQPYRPPWPVTRIALLYGDGVCFLWGTNWTVSTATSSQYLAVNCEPIV